MKNKRIALLSLFLAVILLLTACGGGANNANTANNANANNAEAENNGEAAESTESADGKKIIRTNNGSEPGSLDPALARGTHESWVLEHAFEGLMRYNENDELVEAQAESYEVSEDGTKYTFTLREGLEWSNGDPVTAEDFEYAWKRVCDPELASEYSFQITTYVKGAEEALAGEGSMDDIGVKALDDRTLEVQLKAPTPYFVGLTAFYTLYPINSKIAKENPDWAKDPSNTEYVSNGAFKITGWEHNDKITLEKNEHYRDAENVKIDGIELDILEEKNTEYQKYQGGEYDIITSPIDSVVAEALENDDPELEIGNDIGTYYIEFNNEVKPLNNAKVRNALSMAIDRTTIVENITQGGQKAAEGYVPFGLLDDTGKDFREDQGNLIVEDVEEAKKLLDEGLEEEGMTLDDLNDLGLTLSYNTDESHKKIMQAVQQMWKESLGVEVNLENMEFQVLIDNRTSGDYDLCRAGWVGDYADPNTMLDIYMSNNPQNTARYKNEEYDELLSTAASTGDQKVRMDSMKEAEKIFIEDMPVIPIYFYTQPRLVKPYLTGVYKTLIGYPTLQYADIDLSAQ